MWNPVFRTGRRRTQVCRQQRSRTTSCSIRSYELVSCRDVVQPCSGTGLDPVFSIGHSRRSPMIKNPTDADSCRKSAGMIVDKEPPATAPMRLAITRALEDPRKTASGLSVVPLIATVANCVLSPSSARKTVTKVESSRVRFIAELSGVDWVGQAIDWIRLVEVAFKN